LTVGEGRLQAAAGNRHGSATVEDNDVRTATGVVMVVGRRVVAWVVAVVVTVGLVAGGVTVGLVAGGVLLARDRPEPAPAVLPALDLEAAGQTAAEPAPAAGAVAPARQKDTPDPMLRAWPAVTYRLKGPLPSLPERARAWKLGDTTGPDRVAALAAALGLAGRPRQDATGWTVRDGRRVLLVNRAAGVPWTYGTGILEACGPYRPGPGIQCLDPDAAVTSPSRPAGLPSPAEAERVARDLAARAGLDLDGARVRVVDSWAARTVQIDPAVDGTPTSGLTWTVAVGAKGSVQHASGWLATPEPADTYPLIGVQAGFEELKKFRPQVPMARLDVPAGARRPCRPVGAGTVPCTTRPLAPRVVTVTGARLGLQLAPAIPRPNRPAEVAYLLPAYLFDLEGGWSDVRAVIAVPARYLTRP
jgi:hypothetical protein